MTLKEWPGLRQLVLGIGPRRQTLKSNLPMYGRVIFPLL